MKNLRGKVAVVTGAASGIGRATSVRLAEEGCAVALADVSEAGLEETAAQITRSGGFATRHLVDVSKPESVHALCDEVLGAHGHVHLLVNNAGVTVVDVFRTATLEDFQWIMGVNFWGVVYGCKTFLPHLLREDEAHIVNVSSVYGFVGIPSQSYYCASKFAVRGFTEALAVELQGSSVKVSCVYPGGVRTGIARGARFGTSWNGDDHDQTAAKFEASARSTTEQAAQAIVRGIRKDRRRILIGRDAKFVDLLARLLPAQGGSIVAELVRRGKRRLESTR